MYSDEKCRNKVAIVDNVIWGLVEDIYRLIPIYCGVADKQENVISRSGITLKIEKSKRTIGETTSLRHETVNIHNQRCYCDDMIIASAIRLQKSFYLVGHGPVHWMTIKITVS